MNKELQIIMAEKNREVLPGILMTGAECAPFAKTGGLADVIGTLARELKALGFDIRLMLPFHRVIKDQYRERVRHIVSFSVDIGRHSEYVGVEQYDWDGIPVYFIDNEHYFGHTIYCGGNFEGEQYAYFSRAVIEAIPVIGFDPDIIHVNDWHTAMIPMLLKTQYDLHPQGRCKTVLSIHNLGYQGRFDFGYTSYLLDIEGRYDHSDYIEFHGGANYLKAGIVFADKLVTVSPTYAQEIRTPHYGEGLDGILETRADDLIGILNGIDTIAFNPAADPLIPYPFDAASLSGKQKNKEALIAELGLKIGPAMPVIGMVTRLTKQKGIDLVLSVFDEMMDASPGFVLIGTGDKEYEHFFQGVAHRTDNRAIGLMEFNDPLAHRIYAGSDFFLMPSMFEPCGLSQMIALRYGTLPVVRATGGLKDTVAPYNEYTDEGNGFSFENYNAHDMLHTVRYALNIYSNKERMNSLRKRAMNQNLSFQKSALAYAKLYLLTTGQ
ncbi:MAG: glycogen/starch synthase ADP-glucose type [Syntrophaceae bacterium]|nr:MAG: glycogen/starch synthase ADP-glucose type [Syntrophaceae bacterium]